MPDSGALYMNGRETRNGLSRFDRFILFALGITVVSSLAYFIVSEGRLGLFFWCVATLILAIEAALWVCGEAVMGWLLDWLFPN